MNWFHLAAGLLVWSIAGFWFGLATCYRRFPFWMAIALWVASGPLLWMLTCAMIMRNLFDEDGKGGR